jgi:hypothetical protein
MGVADGRSSGYSPLVVNGECPGGDGTPASQPPGSALASAVTARILSAVVPDTRHRPARDQRDRNAPPITREADGLALLKDVVDAHRYVDQGHKKGGVEVTCPPSRGTRILLGLVLYVTLMIFAVGLRELVRRASPAHEWLGTPSFGAMAVWVGVTLVANGLEGAALDARGGHGDLARALTMGYLLIYSSSIAFAMTAFYMGTAAYATLATGILPRWTGLPAWVSVVLCVLAIPRRP